MNSNRAQIELMNRIERHLILPAGAMPLNSYTRNFYLANSDAVVGTFVCGKKARKWVSSKFAAPHVKDSGCDIVNVRFDLPSDRISAVYCNGEA